MNPKEVLEISGDFNKSPLLDTVRRLHALFSKQGVSYAIIGGMAVVRNGAFRTTHDVDILITHDDWNKIRELKLSGFKCDCNSAVDNNNNISIDILFSGDDGDLVFLLPQPREIAEFDDDLGAYFADLLHIIELKLAVYRQKKKVDGIELAAKDLSDVVELSKANLERIDSTFINNLHPELQKIMSKILKKVRRQRWKKPR